MTNEEARPLYDRAVAAGLLLEPGCRVWLAGQLVTIAWADEYEVGCAGDGCTVMIRNPADVWCDFREASSLGCLLGHVRAAWGDPAACTMSHTVSGVVEWLIWMPGHDRAATPDESRPTESEALVAALEAAPKVQP